MDCPHCGWDLKIVKEWVTPEGYHADLICAYECLDVKVRVSSNLLWAYENNKMLFALRLEAYDILQQKGLLATPP